MPLLLNCTTDQGVPVGYHEVVRLAWDIIVGNAGITIGSWATQAAREQYPIPVETNGIILTPEQFTTLTTAVKAGVNVLTEAETILKSAAMPPGTHWFFVAPWSTAVDV